MAKGFKCGASGGAINFTVKAYPSEVELNNSTASENTIGVVTTNPITGWYFDSERPENMTEGEVWFCTGKSSDGEFNALKKNGIQVYPVSAKQSVSGALVDVKAKTYQSGEWVDWLYWIVQSGIVVKNRLDGRLRVNSDFQVVSHDGYQRIYTTTNIADGFAPSEAIEVTDKSRVVLKCRVINIGAHNNVGVGWAKALGASDYATVFDNNIVARTTAYTTGEHTLYCDVPANSGLYYPCIFADADTGKYPDIYVYDFYVE